MGRSTIFTWAWAGWWSKGTTIGAMIPSDCAGRSNGAGKTAYAAIRSSQWPTTPKQDEILIQALSEDGELNGGQRAFRARPVAAAGSLAVNARAAWAA